MEHSFPERSERSNDETGSLASDPTAPGHAASAPATPILGVPVSLVDLDRAVATITEWCRARLERFVCIRDVHGIMRAQEDEDLLALHKKAGLVTPDGMPLVWIARWRGHRETGRTCGADLVDGLCHASVPLGLKHYFYGGKPGVAQRMADILARRHPGLLIAGTGTPPFGKLAEEEDEAATQAIAATEPHIVWVGLSTPKQEFWMRDHVGRIPGATLIGIGAAFDFHTGDVKRAPRWMQRCGLEWLHRLATEPRRLWRRYLVLAPRFALAILREELTRRAMR